MNLKIRRLTFFLFTFIAFNVQASDSHHMMGNAKKMEKQSRKKVGKALRTALIDILESNEKLHQNFFDYKAKEVETSAKNVLKAINKLKDPEISKLFKFSKQKLTEITAKADRKKNNQNYHVVSSTLAHILSKYDLGSDYNVYYCPMVRKKWIQNSKKHAGVKNPYAPEMPECGRQESKY